MEDNNNQKVLKEIEVKAKVDDFIKLKEKLQELQCELSEGIVQKDTVFIQPGTSYPVVDSGKPVLRIREQGEETILTLKIPQENNLTCIEKEINVNHPEKTKALIELLGFKEMIESTKVRQKAKYQEYEICLDNVEGLGMFVEVEKISYEDSIIVQKELFSFLQKLGIEKENQVLYGYDILMWNKLQNDKLSQP